MSAGETLVQVRNLSVAFGKGDSRALAVDHVSFRIERGELCPREQDLTFLVISSSFDLCSRLEDPQDTTRNFESDLFRFP